jgi:hypothetical protein
MKQQIEFNYYHNKKTNSAKLDLLDKGLNVLGTLDRRDFTQMEKMNLNPQDKQDIVTYCNKYKGTSIGEFEAITFPAIS